MALRTTAHDLYRGSNSMALPTDLSGEIWANAVKGSAVMQLAERITLPGRGLSIPVVATDATASFIGESTEKPVSNPTPSLKIMKPYKVACIELFSEELIRDLPALYDELVRRAPDAIARAFDATVFHGTAPGTGFDVLTAATAVSIKDGASQTTYGKLVTAMETIGAAGGTMNGIALSAQGKAVVLGSTDTTGRPVFVPTAESGEIGRILGARVVDAQQSYAAGTSPNPNVIGVAGDWTQARYGIVDDINISVSRDATVNDGTNLVHLWQSNMVGVRIEAEVGFVVRQAGAFLRLTDATS